jgi:BirA family transcriptional regulator, biotin operon repressor / biotin---[acetyl-CoA-carboxylase] ligase
VDQLVWRVEHFKAIDSTNSWLTQQALDGSPEGLVAFSDFQSLGRGRLDRQWHAPERSALLCSVLFRPTTGADQLQLVVAAVALSARAALVRLCGLRPGLKWPNDLLVEDRKLAGLLAEVVTTADGLAIVVGLGLNLTASPDDVAATDVLGETGITLSPRGLLDIVLEEIEWRYWQSQNDEGRADLRREYENALVTVGQHVRVERLTDTLVGVARGVDDSGHLIVDVDGVPMTFSTGDVVHLRHQLGATT